jgi:two-component system, cell cycle sensor histidine kinase and response regulator CckA
VTDAGATANSRHAFHVVEFLAEISHAIRRSAGERVRLRIDYGRDVNTAKFDRIVLEQFFVGLGTAAREAMPKGGTLTISTSNVMNDAPFRRGNELIRPGEYVQVRVSTTGIDVSEQEVAYILEPNVAKGALRRSGALLFDKDEAESGTAVTIHLPV